MASACVATAGAVSCYRERGRQQGKDKRDAKQLVVRLQGSKCQLCQISNPPQPQHIHQPTPSALDKPRAAALKAGSERQAHMAGGEASAAV